MGTMIGRNWIRRSNVEPALLLTCVTNGLVTDDGVDSVHRTVESGIDDGLERPHPDLGSRGASQWLSRHIRNQPWLENLRWSELVTLFRLRTGACPFRNDIITATGGDPVGPNGREIGKQVRFTFDEYKEMGREALGRRKARHPSTIRPCDADEDQIGAYLNMMRKPAKAAAERRRRARKKEQHMLANEVDCRSSAIYPIPRKALRH
jgi:hypothetical protein